MDSQVQGSLGVLGENWGWVEGADSRDELDQELGGVNLRTGSEGKLSQEAEGSDREYGVRGQVRLKGQEVTQRVGSRDKL